MAARTPTAKPKSETQCRGKWSVCKGKNPSRSEDWHLCEDCTDKRAKAMKAAKPALAKKPAAKPTTAKPSGTTMERELAAVKAMKDPAPAS
jgi:hypothetical protein